MTAESKTTENFCIIINNFNKNFDKEMSDHVLISSSGKRRRYRNGIMSESEIMTILVLFHFSYCRDLKYFYLYEVYVFICTTIFHMWLRITDL